MNNRQVEELAKLFLDIGKLVLASLLFGFFQSDLNPTFIFLYSLIGLTISLILFKMGLQLLKEAK